MDTIPDINWPVAVSATAARTWKSMHALGILLVAAATLFANAALAAGDDLARLSWLAGCWKSETAEAGSGEHWLLPAGGTMLGISRTVKQGKTVEFEFMQIRPIDDGRLAFIALPSGQSMTTFPLLRLSDTEAVFENPEHDFPQRVVYARDGDSALKPRIEGMHDDQLRVIEFPMTRVSCDSPAGVP